MARGTPGRSGNPLGTAWATTTTVPASRALRQVDLMESHDQQLPASSPPSAARRMSAVPLYPETPWTGRPRAALKILTELSGENAPGATPPSLTGVLEAIHLSRLVMPLALVRAQTTSSLTAAPTNSNLRASNSIPA